MRIRRATGADAGAIAGVHVRSWQAAYRGLVPQDHLDGLDPADRRPMWEHLLAQTAWPGRGVLVAETVGGIVGFTGFLPTRDKDLDPAAVAEIATIYLLPEAWGGGTGKALMAEALDTLVRAGYRQAGLWVLDTNARARRFYEAGGWRRDGAVQQDTSLGFSLTEFRYLYSFDTNVPGSTGDRPGSPS
jgi:GNAT superfamily N-acetyltransferase